MEPEGGSSVHYVLLMKLTPEGVKDAKAIPERIGAGIKAWEAMGGKVLSFLVTFGEYDYVAVGDGPSDEAAAAFALALASQGQVTTTTLRGFTPEEFAGVVAAIP
jgi:uncharacterized protein with GYD domain